MSIPEGYTREDNFHCNTLGCPWSGEGWGLEEDESCPICRKGNIGAGLEKEHFRILGEGALKSLPKERLREYVDFIEESGALNPEGEASDETRDINMSYNDAKLLLST